jgi:serine/threonine-protein kinase
VQTQTTGPGDTRPSERPLVAMSPALARETIAQTLARLGVAETSLGGATVTMGRVEERTSGPPEPLPDISVELAVDVSGTRESKADLVAREVIGKGGMGVVRLASQRSLERDVAIKTSARTNARAVRALVREARIMGGLEHPNVVPVHALGVDRDGSPLLVMKRIEGVSWRTLIYDEAHDAWPRLLVGHGDRLRAHIDILVQVTRALALAHDRGVVHRDVKPENVMIGRFGEVYLLDWGLALRLDERDAEPEGIVGTPGFLPPEMARGQPALVDPRTDVYLLGGALYEVLAKRAPHDAPNALLALVASLVGDPPPLPEGTPRDLEHLVRRAMALDPADRVPSAEAFREALVHYLAVREADVVAAEGRQALARAERLLAQSGPDAPDAYRALIEARFALTSTLRVRNDAEARADLDRCLGRMVERELALRSPGNARTLLEEMATPSADLAARLELLDREVAAERTAAEERERARREADSSPSLAAMSAIVYAVVTLIVLVWGFLQTGFGRRDLTPREALEIWSAAFVGLGVVGFTARKQILSNQRTRVLGGFLALALITPFMETVVAGSFGLQGYQRSAVSWVSQAGLAALGEISVLPGIRPAAIVYLLGAIVLLLRPDWVGPLQPIVVLTGASILVRALRRDAARSHVAADDADRRRSGVP